MKYVYILKTFPGIIIVQIVISKVFNFIQRFQTLKYSLKHLKFYIKWHINMF